MSIDNWSICPKCKVEANRQAEKRLKVAAESYGKVSSQEYRRLAAAADAPVNMRSTMRENYEMGVGEDGDFLVNYRASCTECDFDFEYRHEQKVSLEGK